MHKCDEFANKFTSRREALMARKPTIAVVILALTVVFGCGGGTEEKAATFDVAGEFAKVQQARSALDGARSGLEALRAELESLKGKANLAATETARKAELESQLPGAQRAFDEAYESDQNALSAFLNLALNEETVRSAPQTREALRLYADGAIANASNFMNVSGDYGKAIDILQTAESYFEFAGAAVPENLQEARKRAQTFRYLSKDRFDQLAKGMTEAQVKAIAGTPLYANVRETEAQGRKIVMWLFPRDPSVGGAAAVYFDKGKVYAMKWDATAK